MHGRSTPCTGTGVRQMRTVFVTRTVFTHYENTVRIARGNRTFDDLGSRVRPMAGRRELLRESLMQAIRDAALAELRRSGPTELSLREVARMAGISPSGLYRYVEGRDGLLELLIADGFERFGQTVGAAITAAGPRFHDQVIALAYTYRQWAVANPEQFALILGSPVVGFRPDPAGPTSVAVRQFGMPMLKVILDAAADGQLIDFDATHDATIVLDPALQSIPAGLLDISVRSWARIHGLVILEAFGHLAWAGRDVEDLLRAEAESIAATFSTPGTKSSRSEKPKQLKPSAAKTTNRIVASQPPATAKATKRRPTK